MIYERGFTLIELLLSISIITILVGVSLPVYASFTSRNDLDLTTQEIAQAMRRAQTYARGVRGDSAWGVQITSASQFVLYKGASYATRDTAFDEADTIPSTITTSFTGEVNFAKRTATPSITGNFILTSTATNDTRSLSLNAKGMVDY